MSYGGPAWSGYTPHYSQGVTRPKTPEGRKPPVFVIRLDRDRPNPYAWHLWLIWPEGGRPDRPVWAFHSSWLTHAEAIAATDRITHQETP